MIFVHLETPLKKNQGGGGGGNGGGSGGGGGSKGPQRQREQKRRRNQMRGWKEGRFVVYDLKGWPGAEFNCC